MNIFTIQPEELGVFFKQEDIRKGESLKKLIELNGISGLCEKLHTSTLDGIKIEDPPLSLRKSHFGDNQPHIYKGKSIWHFIWVNLSDTVLQILIGAALISLVVGLVQDPSEGWLEGTAILVAVIIVVFVASANDYMKEQQFIKLNRETDTSAVIVTRDGHQSEMSAHELLVGDLLYVCPGEILQVDGILVQSCGLKVDESSITGESALVKKDVFRAGDMDSNPFLASGSTISEGSGNVIVCNVGKYSLQGKQRSMTDQVEDDLETPIQERLIFIAEALGKLGFAAGALLTLVLIGHTGIDGISNSEWGKDEWSEVVNAIILGITILVVAIPEGLPLALTLCMAYSILRMKKENIFVRHLRGCEIMGAATNILSDKTGTLTLNKMKVTKTVLLGKDVGVTGYLSEKEKLFIAEAVSRNSTAFLSEDSSNTHMIGNKTDCALLEMIQQWGMSYDLYRNKEIEVTQYAFSSNLKRMTTVYNLGERGYIVYTKGAGELILQKSSTKQVGEEITELTAEDRKDYEEQFRSLASQCLRIIGFAYKRSNHQELGDFSQDKAEENLIFLGFVGIEDPLRPGSRSSIIKCQESGVTVRMLTGDSIETAIKIAKMSCILPEDLAESELGDYVMEGSELRERTGGLQVSYDENGKIESFAVADQETFNQILKKVLVIARCSPEDKLLLVIGLKQAGEVVGVTGDGSNDAAALKQSDIGLAMMSGTPLAKENSDIILLDDNFESVVNSIKWGRNVYASIRKFIQFQITVNIVALVVSIIGALTVEDSPLTAVQMLWVNLIMDSMAALALATELPNDSLFSTLPFGRTESIITRDMYINIITQGLYQCTALMILLYLGPSLLDIQEGWDNEDWNEENGIHFTLFFNTFVLLQVFNEINCRKLSMDEWNFFSNFFNNTMFIAILFITVVVQVLLVEFGGEALECSGLDLEYHVLCVAIAAGGLIFSFFVRVIVCLVRKTKPSMREEEVKLIN